MARAQPGLLTYLRDDGNEDQIVLRHDVTVLGRSDSCQIVIDNPKVSRIHARIELYHERYSLFDAGSRNGTFVNGTRITDEHVLVTGDEIWLATDAVTLCFFDPEETMSVPLSSHPPALYLDEAKRTVQVYGMDAALSPLEYGLLRYLAAHSGKVCSREDCFLAVWGQPYDHATCEDALNTVVAKLRRHLRAAAELAQQEATHITTIQRVGFRLDTSVTFATDSAEQTLLQERARGA